MTLFDLYKLSIKKLENPDVDEINVRILLCEINHLKSMSDFYLHKDEEIQDLLRFNEYFERYLNGDPLQYILGKASFYGLDFVVDNRVLIPRQESEEVVEFAIKKAHEIFGAKPLKIADVCCGSGIMGITLSKHLISNKIYLSDISKDALDVCKINSEQNKVSGIFFEGDCLEELIKNNIKVDLLISNPPYILECEKLDSSVLDYEPHLALFSDNDFSIYKRIILDLNKIRESTLLCVFEIGTYSREILEPFIKEVIPNCEYKFIKDINGKERILYILLK